MSNHPHELLVDLVLYDYRFQICFACVAIPCQFTMVSVYIGKSDLSQNKWEKSDLSKGIYIYDDQTKDRWVKRGVLEISHMVLDSIVFEQFIYSSSLQRLEIRARKLVIFMGCHK